MFDLAELPWLPEPPADFRRLCRDLKSSDDTVVDSLRTLSATKLDTAQAASLAKTLARLRTEGADLSELIAVRLGVLPSLTFDAVVQMLPAVGIRHGLALEIVAAPPDQVQQQALDPSSAINSAGADYVLLASDHRGLSLNGLTIDPIDADEQVAAACSTLEQTAVALSANSGATVLMATIAEPMDSSFGSFDRSFAGTPRAMAAEVNRFLELSAREHGWPLVDIAELASSVGRAAWFDDRLFNLYKIPFALRFVPIYAEYVCRVLGSLRGRSRKCLVLDLDNTCWGGAIGDEGLEGIVLGMGTAEGESFLALQAAAAELKARGIMLAVSSKNEDAIAREVFRAHPDMILREEDIAVFNANWEDKASNIEAIARDLSIGLDALVFFDDNPVERETVRRSLPSVAVPELPADPAAFARILRSAGYFEAVTFSEEDRSRSLSYATNAQRAEVFAKARNLGEYLQSLEMVMTSSPFDRISRERVTQLINKSNQFNLTSRRYSQAEVASFELSKSGATCYFRLRDRFGDFGIIGVIICTDAADRAWEIDTWLMSCRVLGRQVEEAMLAELARMAVSRGIEQIRARFIPTAKNKIVARHYDSLGFTLTSEADEGHRFYELDLKSYEHPELPINIGAAR